MAELSALERLGFLIEIPQPLHGTQLRERSESAKEKSESTTATTSATANTTTNISDSNRGHDGVPPQQGDQQSGDNNGDKSEQQQQQQRDVQYRFAHGFLPALLQVSTLLFVIDFSVSAIGSIGHVRNAFALHNCCHC
jgi:hypothetical protein